MGVFRIARRIDKIQAQKAGISKAMRQYCKRYGSNIDLMLQEQKKYG